MLITIAEMPEYQKQSKKLLDASEHKAIIDYLATHPRAGVLIQGSGGVRKLRWKCSDKGKSVGVRVIYIIIQK